MWGWLEALRNRLTAHGKNRHVRSKQREHIRKTFPKLGRRGRDDEENPPPGESDLSRLLPMGAKLRSAANVIDQRHACNGSADYRIDRLSNWGPRRNHEMNVRHPVPFVTSLRHHGANCCSAMNTTESVDGVTSHTLVIPLIFLCFPDTRNCHETSV